MSRVAVITQPCLFPYLGYWELLARADQILWLDDVQWNRRSWQRRTRIHQPYAPAATSGEEHRWLSIPLVESHSDRAIQELSTVSPKLWLPRHWAALKETYGPRPHFKTQLEPLFAAWAEGIGRLQTIGDSAGPSLRDATLLSLRLCAEHLGLGEKLDPWGGSALLASAHPAQGARKSQRLLDLCRWVGADVYYASSASALYLDVGLFRGADIDVVWQRYKAPHYLGFFDLAANLPYADLREMLKPNPWRPVARREEAFERLSTPQGSPTSPRRP
jgi:hypothetical protein